MADTVLKTKVQLGTVSVTSNGSSNGGDKTPTTPSKLMINHGKPNFTIQRSPKIQQNGDGDGDPFANGKNNYNAYKMASTQNGNNNNFVVSTKFNGAFKPTNVEIAQKQPHQSDANDNEAAKVVLRCAKPAEPSLNNTDDESVPEFIRRQRRIQERLAKENILDFESRRSGYFTHVMISPTSPNRQSFGATMSSPPVVPSLETPTKPNEVNKIEDQPIEPVITNDYSSEHNTTTEEEEVAKAIEEVNKAVEGEDDEKDDHNIDAEAVGTPEPTTEHYEHVEEVATTNLSVDEDQQHAEIENSNSESTSQDAIVVAVSDVAILKAVENNVDNNVENDGEHNVKAHHADEVSPEQNGHIEVVEVHVPEEKHHDQNDIIISHTNGFDGPSIPAPDPSGFLGVNYEPKTVVSFSKDLGSEPNKYPDTVKVVSQNGNVVDEKLQELSKLKFDIKADKQDVEVTLHAD